MENAAAMNVRKGESGLPIGLSAAGTGIDDVQRIDGDPSAVYPIIDIVTSDLITELCNSCLGIGSNGVGGGNEPGDVIVGRDLRSENEGTDFGVGGVDDGNGLIVSGGFGADVTAGAGDAGGGYGEDEYEQKNESKKFLFHRMRLFF